MQFELENPPFEGLAHNFMVAQNVAFRNLANDVVQEAKDNIAPERSGLHNRTGKLRDSIVLKRFYQLEPGGEAIAIISAGNSRVPYAAIHEKGGTIKAKNRPYLTFKIDNQWFSKKFVNIPARPYLQPAAETLAPKYSEYVEAAMKELDI